MNKLNNNYLVLLLNKTGQKRTINFRRDTPQLFIPLHDILTAWRNKYHLPFCNFLWLHHNVPIGRDAQLCFYAILEEMTVTCVCFYAHSA